MKQPADSQDWNHAGSHDQDVPSIPAETRGGVGWWQRTWHFIIVRQHSNALVAGFSALLFISTAVYPIFAALQWPEMQKATHASQLSALPPNDSGDPALKP